jgi:hypothetical protein
MCKRLEQPEKIFQTFRKTFKNEVIFCCISYVCMYVKTVLERVNVPN